MAGEKCLGMRLAKPILLGGNIAELHSMRIYYCNSHAKEGRRNEAM